MRNNTLALRLPDFIGIGPARTGTTWLHEILKGHAGLPLIKETHFFKRYYEKGLGWYAGHFNDSPPGLPIGEICPSYFNFALARERIAKDLPNCKIICSLRDPVERLYSHYRHIRPLAGIRDSFEDEIQQDPTLMDGSYYARHLEAWLETFGRSNVLIIFYDDLKSSPQAFLDPVCEFIGIPKIDLKASPIGNKRVNLVEATRAPRNRLLGLAAGKAIAWLQATRLDSALSLWRRTPLWEFCLGGGQKYELLSPETEERLREHFRSGVEELEVLTHRDLSSWKWRTAVPEHSQV